MIDPDVRNAIDQLHRAGQSLRQISRQFRVSRHAVREIVREEGAALACLFFMGFVSLVVLNVRRLMRRK